jgi:quercetin dioxygenase-like cupin family protein
MEYGDAVIFDRLDSLEMHRSQPVIYDQEIGVRLLYEDPESGAEHYLIRYPAGLNARLHRHSAAHTIVVLEGRLAVNDRVIGPGAYCHFPAGETMFHAPAGEQSCLFVTIFHGPFDVEPLTEGLSPGNPGDSDK